MSDQLRRLQSRLNAYVWEVDPRRMQRGHRFIVRSMRLLYVIVRDFMAGHLNLHAMGLVYTSLLSLVPALAVMHFGVILREERYLERKFGDEYRQYKASVRRWL